MATGDAPTPAELMRDRIRGRLLGVQVPAQKIGRYRVLREVGRGASGRVLECLDETLERSVAVKLLHDSSLPSSLLRREALALARVEHPNIIHVYDVGQHDGHFFVAMQFVRGRSLREWQRVPGRRWREVVQVYVEAAHGLVAAHDAGVLHRDFKADNVIVSGSRHVHVVDFGLAQPTPELGGDDVAITRSHKSRPRGTPGYMAPEQHRSGLVSQATDQFAFCASLFESVYGCLPYVGRSQHQILLAMYAKKLSDVSGKGSVPKELYRILERGLAFSPDDRWRTMEALLDRLDSVLVSEAGTAAATEDGDTTKVKVDDYAALDRPPRNFSSHGSRARTGLVALALGTAVAAGWFAKDLITPAAEEGK